MSKQFRILIVEDEWLLASELARQLTRAGYGIVGPVPTVAEAIALIEAERPDAAVLDIQLDGAFTFSVAERLERGSTPFMFLSGHPISDFPDQLRDRIVLSKPAIWQEIVKTLAKLLEKEP